MKTRHIMLAGLLLGAFAGTLHADPLQELFDKTHKGAKENKVASDWYADLPKWVASLTQQNNFLETHLSYEMDKGKLKAMRSGVNKFEIRDVDAPGKNFSAYMMVRNGVDANGRPVFVKTAEWGWLPFGAWPARYVVETYPVETNTNDTEVVGLAAWLYSQKENELANRVLTIVHRRNSELAPLIEAYICAKEKWTRPDDGLVSWNMWDAQYQRERLMLVTPADRDNRVKAREKEADTAFKALIKARGDYKGRPPRRTPPSSQLILVEWELKQFKIAYASSDFLKDQKNIDRLQEIQDSITDDLAIIKDNVEKSRTMGTEASKPNELKAKAEFLEEVLKIDPMDLNLRSLTANAWYTWGNPAPHGNGCDRNDGIKAAIPHYKVILEAFPNNTGFLLALGRCYQALGDSKTARPYYDKVIEIDGTAGNGPNAAAFKRNMDQADTNRSKK